jgi:hypothetical protein
MVRQVRNWAYKFINLTGVDSMKIKTIEANTKKPTKNLRIQLQVKGKDSGYLTLTSDMEGFVMLDEKYKGQQIAVATTGGQPSWIAATDGATLVVTATTTHAGTTGDQGKGGKGGQQGGKQKDKETWK